MKFSNGSILIHINLQINRIFFTIRTRTIINTNHFSLELLIVTHKQISKQNKLAENDICPQYSLKNFFVIFFDFKNGTKKLKENWNTKKKQIVNHYLVVTI
ncbi:hypothetical protein BpHYR1_038091 [Brachionus plicatilis]|uniref:Uncharacterized protein n=1 Tax=Brachionus plicatilis TaxID=10195 RepID=A0A3M7Q3S5_BRAPC|nr:hypothetical protein BpHYR1_038091 [Brachionus plicatilis]